MTERRDEKKWGGLMKGAILGGGLIVAVVGGVLLYENGGLGGCSEKKMYARVQDAIRAQLRAPASAVFASIGDVTFKGERREGSGICSYSVSGYVDAQNSFGAILRHDYTVSLFGDTDPFILSLEAR